MNSHVDFHPRDAGSRLKPKTVKLPEKVLRKSTQNLEFLTFQP